MQLLERCTIDDINGVNDVSERLGHFPSESISDHWMTVDLLEWHLTSELDTEKDHSSDPEKDDVPSSLEDRVGVEVG